MLEEMNKKHSPGEDAIHNWLCDQDDVKLLEGILKDGKSIKGALEYCAGKAKEHKTGNFAMVDDKTVFGWVKKYFTSSKTDKVDKVVAKVEVGPASSPAKPKEKATTKAIVPKPKKEKGVVEGQLDLFGCLA